MSTREEWLSQAGTAIYDTIISPIAVINPAEKWAVSCGFPSKSALSHSRRRVGECWSANASADGATRHLFISPLLVEPVDGIGDGVLPVLTHELVHVVSTEPGHRGEFRRIALAVGLTGNMTATVAGSELAEKLTRIAGQLGPYPHVLITKTHNAKRQSTRMIKVMATKCTECEYVARTTRVWLDEFGPPKCPHGSEMEIVI